MIIYDADGAGAKNVDLGLFKKLVPVMGNYFPESLHRMFLVRCGFVISTIYSAVEGFMHERTKKKVAPAHQIKVLKAGKPEDTAAVLSETIPLDVIPVFLGGTNALLAP